MKELKKCPICELNPSEEQDPEEQEYEREHIVEEGICSACLNAGGGRCVLCSEWFMPGETGNELGFCCECQAKEDFPYDLDAYYKDYDNNKVEYEGFSSMESGLLEPYRKKVIKHERRTKKGMA